MPHTERPPLTRGVVLRGLGLAVAVALGGVAAWLIVTGATQPRRVELGVLAGLWAALVAAFSMFGSRRFAHPAEAAEARVVGTELELRSAKNELQRAEDAAARRAHEARLEQLLRTEIHVAVGREVAALRSEIAELRAELVEKVGGQLRLERTETTRLIGSDLEALQREIRQLKAAAQEAGPFAAVPRFAASDSGPMRPIVESARVRPVSREAAEVEAEVQPARAYDARPTVEPLDPVGDAPDHTTAPIRLSPLPMQPAPPEPAPQPVLSDRTPEPAPQPELREPAAQPELREPAPQPEFSSSAPSPAPRPSPAPEVRETRPQPQPAAPEPDVARVQPLSPPSPAPSRSPFDDLAALPRITPFTDFELDPIEPPHEITPLPLHDLAGRSGATTPGAAPGEDEPAYTGRRRRTEDNDAEFGRHARRSDASLRRHRHAEDDGDDLLARLLAREGSRR